MSKLSVSYNKKLKLSNVLSTEITLEANQDVNIAYEKMNNYIKSKGLQPLGPPIQYHNTKEVAENDLNVTIKLMQQTTGFISNPEKPYKQMAMVRVSNCLYTRYQGTIERLNFAYQKLLLTAYEEDIHLKGDSYLVVLDEVDGQVTVDLFMECIRND